MAAERNKQKESFNVKEWNEKGYFQVVVGIDFGTDGSGIAWAVNDGNGKVFIEQEINDNSKFVDLKTKTNILLKQNGEFVAFGREATEKYIREFEDEDSEDDDDDDDGSNKKKEASPLYFSQFKMSLYKKAIKKQAIITQRGPGNNDAEKKGGDNNYKTDIKTYLTAANGQKLPTRTVFIEALKFMKQHAFKMFEGKKVSISDEKHIKWVLTVPAIWSDKSKGLMEKWAIEAGLITDKKVLNQLVIAYEPDCASVSIQNEIKDYKRLLEKKKEDKKEDDNDKKIKPKQYLVAGEKYLLLDLGGGTADIACHQVIDDFTVKEVYQPSGGAWGSSNIDRHFIRLLTDLFPKGWISQFQKKRPSDFTILLNNFRTAKETFYARHQKQYKGGSNPDPSQSGNEKKSHNITLPPELMEFLDGKLEIYNKLQRIKNKDTYETLSDYMATRDFLGTPGKWMLSDDQLELDYSVWTHIFDEVIDQIVDHCKNLLKLQPLNNKQCRYVCLVGGFSSSKYLQSRIMYELGIKSEYRLIVITPKKPSLSVVDGAVRLGLKPGYIKSRIIRKTYGIKINAPLSKYNLNELDAGLVSKNRYFNKRANQEYLHNIFHAYVRRGDQIEITDPPKTTKFYASRRNTVGIDVYSSDQQNPVFLEGKPIAKKDVQLPSNWDIHNTFHISFFFGDTKIRVFADIDGIEEYEKEIHLEYEWEAKQQEPKQEKYKQEKPKPKREEHIERANKSERAKQEEPIQQICRQIGEYYKSLNVNYDSLFTNYCNDNGFDDDMVKEELQNAEECMLVDFDENFPFAKPPNDADDRNQKIYDLIKKCLENDNLSFTHTIPDFNKELFNITEEELNKTKELYRTQCAVLWNSGMEEDDTFLRLVTIGQKYKFDYLQHLVDDYFRGRVENIENVFDVETWARNHKHFRNLEKLNQTKKGDKQLTPYELGKGAVKAFGARCCPKLLFSNIMEIDDSLEIVVNYISAAIEWIGNMIKNGKALPPFQIDLCLAYGPPLQREQICQVPDNNNDDDDDDDDEKDEKYEMDDDVGFVDCIGDIKAKLDKNDLKYETIKNESDFAPLKSRIFGNLFEGFQRKIENNEKRFSYPHRNRFITFIDRRDRDKSDTDNIWMYQPPPNCRNIPNNAVPEWYLNASKTCLLPNMDYGDGKAVEEAGKKPQNATKEKLKNSNIGSTSHAKGSLLTFSIIVKEADVTKIYLFWNGQIARFFPNDIKTVLPKLFNIKWNNGVPLEPKHPPKYEINEKTGKKVPIYEQSVNEIFMGKEEEIDAIINRMNHVLIDEKFNSFRQSYK